MVATSAAAVGVVGATLRPHPFGVVNNVSNLPLRVPTFVPLCVRMCPCRACPTRVEYEELKTAKEKAEEDTIFSFKRKKGCQAERKQVMSIMSI